MGIGSPTPVIVWLFPEISASPIETDSEKKQYALRESTIALVNKLKKENIAIIEADNWHWGKD